MLDWLKKLGGAKPFENKVGLESKSLSLLVQDIGALEKLDADLAKDSLRYVLDGVGEEVLARLAATQGVDEALELVSAAFVRAGKDENARTEFFASLRCSDPQFFVRLGKFYEAASRYRRTQLTGQFGQLSRYFPLCLNNPALEWLEILLIEAAHFSVNTWPPRCLACPALNAGMVESILQAEGHPPELLVRAVFQPQQQRFTLNQFESIFVKMGGIADLAVRHKPLLVSAFSHTDFKQRVYALEMMKKCKVPAGLFIEELVELALSSSKQVREQAESLLADAKATARPLIERRIIQGTTDEKLLAIALLWAWEGEKVRPFLQSRSAEEKSEKVRRAIEDALTVATPAAAPSAATTLELPPLAPIPSEAPLGPETERAWFECFQKINDAIARFNAGQAGQHPHTMKSLSSDAIRKSFDLIQSSNSTKVLFEVFSHGFWQREFTDPLREFWQRPELNVIHLIRFLIHLGAIRSDRSTDRQILSYGSWLETLLPVFRRAHPEVGMRELAAAFTVAELDPRRIGQSLLQSYHETISPFGLPPAQIWPYWAENLHLLEQAFGPSTGGYMDRYYQKQRRRNSFHALATFPHPHERLVPLLWKLALGPKSERAAAQRCLEALPDKFERLVACLSGGEAETRFAAAEWLGRLGNAAAVEPLLAALKREKNEIAKGGMMSALELLGVSVEQFLDRKTLLKEAEKGVAKGVPDDLKWFPFDRLPVVHWADNRNPVEPAIFKWWLIQGFKLKNPEAGPLLRKYCASLVSSEREALGQFVLEAWLARDTSPRVGADAEKEAMKRAQAAVMAAQQWAQWVQQNPQMAQGMAAYAPPNKTLQEHYEDLLPIVQKEPTGTAISSKGVLCVAGACVGAGAAPLVGRYLKDWYGMRAAQCRALLQMLAWVEHKTATQLLLAVGSRFRTKGIQEEANKQAHALAERKGWTVAELADRTIPTAGLDDEGVLTLDFGPRKFTARLTDDLEFALSDPDGKPIKSLPDPRKDDDEAKAAEAKKIYSSAKKELKSVVTMQRDRFYEAMCTQRTWPFEDWNTYLNRHPIAKYHCQRLVWGVVRDEKLVALFRPLPDGSLTDVNDDPVTLKPEDLVRVAHECQITPEQSQAWRQHLKDYEVESLFEQFGRPNFELTDERKQADELVDFRGHVLEAFKLRGRASKLGYTRGQAQDGGWFLDYHKRFPTLGIDAVLEFTGNSLPEENRKVALTTFHFDRVAPDGESAMGGAKMSLGEVPTVLLSECWNDLRQIAAEGPGFDPNWEKNTEP